MANPGRIRPMDAGDIPAIARIFMKVFRESDAPASDELKSYMDDVFFKSPAYVREHGSLVYEDGEGRVTGALSIIPLAFRHGDQPLNGKLLCGYMVEDTTKKGGAELAVTVRARNQELTFSETAKPISADMMVAMGGVMLPVQSLEFVRIFRPAGLVAALVARSGGWKARLPIKAPARLFDRLLRRLVPKIPERPEGLHDEPVERDEFIRLAPDFVQHYAIRPVWSEAELRFILDMAEQKTKNGPFTLRKLVDAKGRVIGLFAYYGAPGRIATVINMLSLKGKESDVVPAVMAALEAAGCVAVRGMCQPRQIDWLYRDRGMIFRHNAYFLAMTKFPEVKDALQRSDIYIGGLAGETWSRLVSDNF